MFVKLGLRCLLLIALIVGGGTTSWAQQSGFLASSNGAVGNSLEDSSADADRAAVDAKFSSTVQPGVFSSGMIRQIDHNGYKAPASYGYPSSLSFSGVESSVFASGLLKVWADNSSQLQVGPYLGAADFRLGYGRHTPTIAFDLDDSGSSQSRAALYGARGIYVFDLPGGSIYALGSLGGISGTTSITDRYFESDPASYDYSGYRGSIIVGTQALLWGKGNEQGVKLDVSGSLSRSTTSSETFNVNYKGVLSQQPQADFASTTAGASLRLISDFRMADSTLLQFFGRASVRTALDYKNEVDLTYYDPKAQFVSYSFSEAPTSFAIEGGVSYRNTLGLFGTSVFYDGSADYKSVGGTISATFMLN
jgi:hypothetical protein